MFWRLHSHTLYYRQTCSTDMQIVLEGQLVSILLFVTCLSPLLWLKWALQLFDCMTLRSAYRSLQSTMHLPQLVIAMSHSSAFHCSHLSSALFFLMCSHPKFFWLYVSVSQTLWCKVTVMHAQGEINNQYMWCRFCEIWSNKRGNKTPTQSSN